MKNNFAKILPLVLALLCIAALAACDDTGSGTDDLAELFTYELSDDGSYYILTGVTDKNVTEVKIPASYKNLPVKGIGKGAFNGCKSLKDIELHSGIHKIDEEAFEGLDTVEFNEYDNGYYLGYDGNPHLVLIKAKNTEITSCDIPEGTMLMYYFAFKNCKNLETLTVNRTKALWEAMPKGDKWDQNTGDFVVICTDGRIPEDTVNPDDGNNENNPNNPETHEHSFTNYESDGNATCTADGTKTAKCDICDETDIITDAGSKIGHSFTNYIPDNDGTETAKCDRCDETDTQTRYSEGLRFTINQDGQSYSVADIGNCKDTDISIPPVYDGLPVTSIGDSAFSGCSGLTGLVIPDSVTSIRGAAFYRCCGLTGLVIPDSVTYIVAYAFLGCSGFTGDLIIPDSVTTIGWGAFSGCSELTGNLVIPDSVTSIDKSAFYGCSGLTGNLVIPDSVTSIGSDAFSGCSGITSINYDGSIEKWNTITKGFDWDADTDNYTIYCTDGTIAKDGTVTYY